jgi:hypothetical protein
VQVDAPCHPLRHRDDPAGQRVRRRSGAGRLDKTVTEDPRAGGRPRVSAPLARSTLERRVVGLRLAGAAVAATSGGSPPFSNRWRGGRGRAAREANARRARAPAAGNFASGRKPGLPEG